MKPSVWRFLLPGVALCAAAVCSGQVAPVSIIEVGDGNTVVNTLGCDWNLLNNTFDVDSTTPGTACGVGATINAYLFRVGQITQNRFTQGSKDIQEIGRWRWDSNGSPDKDALTHGYAISYTKDSQKILAFGAERFAVNGDANIGIWFFQKEVKPLDGGGFQGEHVNGDIFAVSAFTGGGGHPNLDVYEWDTTCLSDKSPAVGGKPCVDKNFRLLYSGAAGQLCGASDPGCASVNTSEIEIGWPYRAKFSLPGNTVPANGFFEGGFNLTAIFPTADLPCFSSFLLDTRTSQSLTASTKDFLAGSFPECKIAVTKACQCSSIAAISPTVTWNYVAGGTVSNTGGGTVYNVKVFDQEAEFSCGTMNPTDVMSWGNDTSQVKKCTGGPATFVSSSAGPSNTATATATTGPSTTSVAVPTASDTQTCASPNLTAACTTNPGLEVDLNCATALQVENGRVVVRVDYNGTARNVPGSNPGTLTSVVVTHTSPGSPATQTFSIGTLTTGQSKCYTKPEDESCPAIDYAYGAGPQAPPTGAASYFPNTLSNDPLSIGYPPLPSLILGRARFENSVEATGYDPVREAITPGTGTITATKVSKHCFVCPFGYCATEKQ